MRHSPIYQNKITGFHAYRSYLIDSLAEPKFTYRLGMPQRPFKNLSDYFSEIFKINPLFIIRGNKIIDIVNNKKMTFEQYLQEQNWRGCTLTGKIANVNPQMQDLLSVQKFYWSEARLRYSFKAKTSLRKFLSIYRNNCQLTDFLRQNLKTLYLEIRPCDSGPQGEETAMAALFLGLLSNLYNAKRLYNSLSWDKWRRIRKNTISKSMEYKPVWHLIKKALLIAETGLQSRRLGEEKYLLPLWERFRQKQNPAIKILQIPKTNC